MTNQTHEQNHAAAETVLVRVADSAYGVPAAVLEQHCIAPERRAALEAALHKQAPTGEPAADAPLYEVPEEVLAPYQVSDEEGAMLEAQHAQRSDDAQGFDHRGGPRNPYPIRAYTGYHANEFFGGVERGVFIGVFPIHREQLPPPSQPGLGLR